jgi:lipoate-protein ligase A
MLLLDLTLESPAANVALDEALLDAAEAGEGPSEMLRLWEPAAPQVVLGRTSKLADEVDETVCRERGIPIHRRTSGGAAIVAGPGCLMYAVLLGFRQQEHLRMIDQAHAHVLARVATALRSLDLDAQRAGTSDLAIGGLKVSGNSLRVKREHLLYHGTLLYDFPLELIARCLKSPPRQPAYRAGRGHGEFVTNLPVDGDALRSAIVAAWGNPAATREWPRALVDALLCERYEDEAWTRQR